MADNLPVVVFNLFILVTVTTKILASSDNDAKFDALIERITHLEERDQLQQDQINDLSAQLLSQKQRTVTLESFVRRLRKFKKSEINFVQPGSLSNVPKTSDFKVNGQIKRPGVNRIRRAENEMDVAFFATLTHHQMNVGINQPIIFDNVVTNIGDSYHSHLGSFIAPVPGTYVFSVSLLSWSQAVDYDISKNGNIVSQLTVHAETSHYDHSSQTVVLQLVKNDDINIRNKLSDRNTHGSNYSTFAGFLLKQQYADVIVG